MEARFEKLCELFHDEAVAKQLLTCSSEEATMILREQYQLEFTPEEMDDVFSGIKAAAADGASDELSCDQLDHVAGGESVAYIIGYCAGVACKILIKILLKN